jgi:hypothetical protein
LDDEEISNLRQEKPAPKELSDEEILDIAKENTFEFGEIPPVQFARAILKKASEK